MAGYEGFAELGNLIAGGEGLGNGARRGGSYPDRLKQNFNAFDALNQARISRAQANARERLSAQMVTQALSGDPAALGELGAATMGMATGQPNLSTFTGGLKDLGDVELQRQQVAAAEKGDVDRLNRLTAIAGDKVLDRTKITDGVAFDPLGAPDQALVVTPLGQATIGQREAAAQAALVRAGASANASDARAGLYTTQAEAGGWNPRSGKAGPTAVEQQAKINFILAEGTRLAAKNGDEWAQAWMRQEAAENGIDMGAFEPEGVAPAAISVEARTPAARGWTQPEVQQAIADARRAITSGRITREEAKKRLLDAGLSNAAGRL